jgi:hypothetical protein
LLAGPAHIGLVRGNQAATKGDKKMRMKLEEINFNTVVIEYDTDYARVTRVFTCPINGGYVREALDDGNARQVCALLATVGPTLSVSRPEYLAACIRREYRRRSQRDRRVERM